MILYVFLASFIIHTCLTINPCCTGENQIIKRKCIDGSQLSGLTCPHKYVIKKENDFELDANDNLLIASSIIPPDRFCSTIMNASEVYIVCFSTEDDHKIVYQVNAILELVSVVFLLITIAVYLQVPDLLDLQGICILNSISGLAISFIALAANQLSTKAMEQKLCISFAYVIYFSMLYSFFWLNVLSFHIWRTVAKPKHLKNNLPWPSIYHLFGIGGPVMLVIILVIAHSMEHSDIHPGFGVVKCWFQSTKSQFIYFYSPMAFLLCLNIIYYGWTVAVLWKDLNNCDERKTKVLKYKVSLCLKLLLIMGILWVFELLSAAFQSTNHIIQIIWYITDCVNTLQGILIFLILVVFRKKVLRGLASRSFCGMRLPQKWNNVADDECEDIEEELGLSETQIPKT